MQLEKFLTAAEAIVDSENVSREPTSGAPEGLDGSVAYGDPFPLSRPHRPGPAVRPDTVDQVRELVRAANRFEVPMWTVSRGKNLGYGGSAPVVILDLHRMNTGVYYVRGRV